MEHGKLLKNPSWFRNFDCGWHYFTPILLATILAGCGKKSDDIVRQDPTQMALVLLPSGPMVDVQHLRDAIEFTDRSVMKTFELQKLPTTQSVQSEVLFGDVIKELSGRQIIVIEPAALRDAFEGETYANQRMYMARDLPISIANVVRAAVNTEYEAGDPATGLQSRTSPDLKDKLGSRMVPIALITRDFVIIVPIPVKETEKTDPTTEGETGS